MQIHWAAKRGDNLDVERQLRRGAAVDALDHEGKTPLMHVCESTSAASDTLALLIERGANVNARGQGPFDTPLILAAHGGDLAKVRVLLRAGADLQYVNRSGFAAITMVSGNSDVGHVDVLATLLEAGVDPNTTSTRAMNPLYIALEWGNYRAIRLLLDHGAKRDSVGMTELMWAVALGSVDDVARELASGGDLAARNCWGMTPWLLALLTGEIAKSKLLLASGARLDDRASFGRTNLMMAVFHDHAELCGWLLTQGADVHAVDEGGQTALQAALERKAVGCVRLLLDAGARLETSGARNAITQAFSGEIVRLLIQAGIELDQADECGNTPLKSAVERGDEEVVRELLELGANPDITTTGDTALHKAVNWDHLRIVKLLLQHGADPNAADVDLCVPLTFARSLECVELLLAAGADVSAQDQIGAEVIESFRDLEIVERLRVAGGRLQREPGATGGLIHTAAKDGDLELLNYLLSHKVKVDTTNHCGQTALIAASEHGHLKVLHRRLEAGADPNIRDVFGRAPLCYAAAPESGVAFQLTQQFAQTDFQDLMKGILPEMDEAVREALQNIPKPVPNFGYQPSDSVEAIDILLEAGAELESRDDDGATPLLVACRCGRAARVARLIEQGADVDTRDNSGNSCIEMAAEHHDSEQGAHIVRLLQLAN